MIMQVITKHGRVSFLRLNSESPRSAESLAACMFALDDY